MHPQIQHVQSCTQHNHISSREHAWLKIRIAHLCVLKIIVMSRLPLFASSPIFPLTSQTPTKLLEHYEHLGSDERSHCDDLRQSGGFTQTVTPTRRRQEEEKQEPFGTRRRLKLRRARQVGIGRKFGGRSLQGGVGQCLGHSERRRRTDK